jgi:hypothetical protein
MTLGIDRRETPLHFYRDIFGLAKRTGSPSVDRSIFSGPIV